MGEAAIGSVVGGVRLEAEIGRGGMGVVYRGQQLALNRQVAVKVVRGALAGDEAFGRRFRRECEIAASLEHPHVVPIYSAHADDGQLSVTMRYIDGIDLGETIRRFGRLSPAQATEVMIQIASALDAAHRQDLVHRDVKPANILIRNVDGRPHAYLTDFGLSRATEDPRGLTGTGMLMGTPDYMAPEQYENADLDQRADVYALGCVLFQCLTGRTPFHRDSAAAMMWAHFSEPPPSPRTIVPALPPELDTVVHRALAKKPDDRFQSAGELARALEAVTTGSPVGPWTPRSGGTPTAVAYEGRSSSAPRTSGMSSVTTWSPVGPSSSSGPPHPSGPTHPSYPAGPTHPSVPYPRGSSGPPRPTDHSGPPWSGAPAAPVTRRRRSRWLTVGVPAAAVLLVAVVVAVVLTSSGAPGTIEGPPIPIGANPVDIEQGAGYLWTANADDGTVSRIDPATGTARSITVGGVPTELVVDQGAVWIANYTDSITRLDVASETTSSIYTDPSSPITGIAGGDGYLWLSHSSTNAVTRIDMAQRTVDPAPPIAVGRAPQSLLYDNHRLYVSNTGDRSISVIDQTGRVLGGPLVLSRDVGGMEADGGTIYVATGDVNAPAESQDFTLVPVDAASFIVGDPIPLGRASWFDTDDGAGWAIYPLTNEIRRIDLATGAPSGDPISGIGRGTGSMLVRDGELWVTDVQNRTVTRVVLDD